MARRFLDTVYETLNLDQSLSAGSVSTLQRTFYSFKLLMSPVRANAFLMSPGRSGPPVFPLPLFHDAATAVLKSPLLAWLSGSGGKKPVAVLNAASTLQHAFELLNGHCVNKLRGEGD